MTYTVPSPAAIKRKLTMRRKSFLMTQHLLTTERVLRRLPTREELYSPEWKEREKRFIELFMPLLEKEKIVRQMASK